MHRSSTSTDYIVPLHNTLICYRSSTYLHKLWNDKVRVPMVLKKKTPVLEKDMRLLNHISSISEVVMDDTVSDLSSYRKMILVSREDQEEVQWSRKTLGRYTCMCAHAKHILGCTVGTA